jgi:CheY-like chemotaxis protein
LEAPGLLEANALLAHEHDLTLIVADARLGLPLWELADVFRTDMPEIPLIILTTRPDDENSAVAHGAVAVLRQPFQTQQFLACVAQFAQPGA